MIKHCCICDAVINRGYFCYKCYSEYKDAILSNAEWVKELKKFTRKERKQNSVSFIYLGDDYDIDTEGNLVFSDLLFRHRSMEQNHG